MKARLSTPSIALCATASVSKRTLMKCATEVSLIITYSPLYASLVCDKLASECAHWSSTTFDAADHCHASDKGLNAKHYKTLRDASKRGSILTPASYNSGSAADITSILLDRLNNIESMVDNYLPGSNRGAKGPFKPDNPAAKKDKTLTKCRKCSYYNKFEHMNFTKSVGGSDIKAHRTGPCDWCHACGRVASTKDFQKEQSKKYEVETGDAILGTKDIPFTVKAHDPRKLEVISNYWTENEGSPKWVYSEADMENDFYRHRIGKQPTLLYILQSIPVTENDAIPEGGDPRRNDIYIGGNESEQKPSVCENEAILLENKADLSLLQEVYFFGSSDSVIGTTLTSTWNKTRRNGVSFASAVCTLFSGPLCSRYLLSTYQNIQITVYLKKNSFVETHVAGSFERQRLRKALFSRLLGCFYNVFPFKLSDLTNGIHVKPLSKSSKESILRSGRTGLRPNILTEDERMNLLDDIGNDAGVKAYNKEVDDVSKRLSFKASTRTEDCGVVADRDATFVGTLKCITSASLVDDVSAKDQYYGTLLGHQSGISSKLGVASTHRNMRNKDSRSFHSTDAHINPSFGFTSYLDPKEYGLMDNLLPSFTRVNKRCNTMNGLLQQCENLGHAPAGQAEGLNVKLFDFQSQAVGWALDREREGGVERFLWTKLPDKSRLVLLNKKATEPCQLYYSPVLDMFRTSEPPDIRGGLIASQMGLG